MFLSLLVAFGFSNISFAEDMSQEERDTWLAAVNYHINEAQSAKVDAEAWQAATEYHMVKSEEGETWKEAALYNSEAYDSARMDAEAWQAATEYHMAQMAAEEKSGVSHQH